MALSSLRLTALPSPLSPLRSPFFSARSVSVSRNSQASADRAPASRSLLRSSPLALSPSDRLSLASRKRQGPALCSPSRRPAGSPCPSAVPRLCGSPRNPSIELTRTRVGQNTAAAEHRSGGMQNAGPALHGLVCFDHHVLGEGKSEWPEVVGMNGHVAAKKIECENPSLTATVVKEGSVVTADFRCDRVRVFVDHDEIVTKTPVIR